MRQRIILLLTLLAISAGSAFGQLSLSSSPNPSTFGQPVTLTAGPVFSFSTVTFFDGGSSLGSVDSNGNSSTVSLTTSTLTVGVHSLTACVVNRGTGQAPGTNCSSPVSQTVNPIPTSLSLSSSLNPSSPCQSVTFTASISPNTATGSVTFFDGTATIGSAQLSNGTASITVASLSAGTHQIQARYVPDQGFGGSSSALAQTVSSSATATLSSSPNPSGFGQSVTLSVTVSPTPCAGAASGPTPTGTVTFFDGSTQIGQSALSGGSASFSTSTLSVGTHGLDARYNGDGNYAAVTSNSVSQTVNTGRTNTTTALSASASTITTSQSVTLTAVVSASGAASSGPTGSVQFFRDGTAIGTANLANGSASFTASNLTAGSHTFTATYGGDNNFNSSTSNPVTVQVNNATTNTTTSLSASATSVNTTTPVTLSATVSPSGATGQVQFRDGGTTIGTGTLSGGSASFTTGNLTAGSHTFTAVYAGDSNFNGSTSNAVTVNVTPAVQNTTTTLSASSNTASPGGSVTLTAAVTPSGATGTVTFRDGGTTVGTANLSGGTASVTAGNLTAGSHTFTATYNGDNNFNGSTSNGVTVSVGKANSNTTVTAAPNPATAGQPVTITAIVTPTGATGTVQFTDNGASLGSANVGGGTASVTTSSLAQGSHSITATYSGDNNFNGSSASTSLTVGPQNLTPTTTSLSVSPNPANVGQTVSMTATVSPSNATGTVTFLDNGSTLGTSNLSGGAASFSTSSLPAGTHVIVAVYNGSTTFNSSSSSPVSLAINSPSSRTTLSAAPNPSTFGQTVVLSATVSSASGGGVPTGSVTFNDGSDSLGTVPLTNGSATLSTSTLTVGVHTLVAVYSGDSTFGSSTSLPVTQQVNKGVTTTTLSASPTAISPGQAVQLTARISPATATGTVTFMDGGTAIGGPVQVVNGTASTSTSSLTQGNHSITAVYSGDANFTGSTSGPVVVSVGLPSATITLSANPTTVSLGQQVTLTATVGPSGATGTVTFLDNGSTLGTATLSAAGTATFSTSSLTAGNHSITAMYSGDSKFGGVTSAAVTVTVNGKVNSTTTLTATPNPVPSGQAVTLKATVTPAAATGTVTFLDGGASIGTATLSNGTATTTVTLPTGTHSLTASYGGDTNTNGSTSTAVSEVVTAPTTLGSISPTSLPDAFVGIAYSQTFTITGGTTPLTWTLVSGSVPGLTLSSAGVLSGTPTTAGTTSLTIRVSDSANPAQAAATVLTLTVRAQPTITLTAPGTANPQDQVTPQSGVSSAFAVPLVATYSLSFTPNAANLPANFTNPGLQFATGGTVTGNINIPPNSTTAVLLPAVQVGTVAGTIAVKLQSLTANGVSVLPSNPVVATIVVSRAAPVIVPGSVKITNITSTGFTVVLDGVSSTRDLTSASLTFTAASGATLNGATETVSLTSASTTWFSDTGAGRGVANGGAFSLTIPFNYSGDPNAIGTVSVTITNSVGTSAAVSGGK